MFPNQLIGKLAIRKAPLRSERQVDSFMSVGVQTVVSEDYSMTREPILILAATESHILYQYRDGIIDNSKTHILDCRWVDDNWTDYEELMKLADPEHVKMMQSLQEDAS